MGIDVKDEEAAMAVNERLFLLGEIALDGEEHSGEGFAILRYRRVIVFIKPRDAEEVAEKSLAFKDISIVGEALVGGFVIIVFIVDVAYNLLKNIL